MVENVTHYGIIPSLSSLNKRQAITLATVTFGMISKPLYSTGIFSLNKHMTEAMPNATDKLTEKHFETQKHKKGSSTYQ